MWYPGSGVVLYCIDSLSFQPFLLLSLATIGFIRRNMKMLSDAREGAATHIKCFMTPKSVVICTFKDVLTQKCVAMRLAFLHVVRLEFASMQRYFGVWRRYAFLCYKDFPICCCV